MGALNKSFGTWRIAMNEIGFYSSPRQIRDRLMVSARSPKQTRIRRPATTPADIHSQFSLMQAHRRRVAMGPLLEATWGYRLRSNTTRGNGTQIAFSELNNEATETSRTPNAN